MPYRQSIRRKWKFTDSNLQGSFRHGSLRRSARVELSSAHPTLLVDEWVGRLCVEPHTVYAIRLADWEVDEIEECPAYMAGLAEDLCEIKRDPRPALMAAVGPALSDRGGCWR